MRRKHHDLQAWQLAMELVTSVYRLTASFPREETYGLSAQMRRSAVSVPSNLAEGAARESNREKLQFFSIARGSLSELETQLFIARNLGYIREDDETFAQLGDVFGLTGGLIRSLKRRT